MAVGLYAEVVSVPFQISQSNAIIFPALYSC
jgi:hypothetical protein